MEIYAGIDLGGTAIKGSIAGRDGTILADDTIATESHLGPEGVLERMAGLVNRLAVLLGPSGGDGDRSAGIDRSGAA